MSYMAIRLSAPDFIRCQIKLFRRVVCVSINGDGICASYKSDTYAVIGSILKLLRNHITVTDIDYRKTYKNYRNGCRNFERYKHVKLYISV